jgi:Flp pilus assembly protein TadG
MVLGLWKNKRGTTAVIFALVLLPIVLVMGMAIDMQRSVNFKKKMELALDTATLAASNLRTNDDVDTLVDSMVRAHLNELGVPSEDISIRIDRTITYNSRRVEAIVQVKYPLILMSSRGERHIDLEVRSVAEQAISNIEIAMVLDVSSSMRGNRIANLKAASLQFIDSVLTDTTIDTTSVNVVPFGGTVNIGDLFDHFAVLPGHPSTIENPNTSQYNIGQAVEDQAFRFSNGDKCLEARKEDYDTDRIPPNSRAQVPHFWRWWNFHPWCPGEDSSVLLNSNKPDVLKTRLDNMVLSDGTGMDVGAMWGLKVLSPDFRGIVGGDYADRPLDFDAEDSRKIMIIMTDGEITAQNRPKDVTRLNVHTNRNSNRVPNQNSYSNQGNRNNMQTVLSKGGSSHTSSHDSAIGRFLQICETAKQNNISIYTIGFQIKKGSIADKNLKVCASSESQYYHVESLDISEAFEDIAARITELRITQ